MFEVTPISAVQAESYYVDSVDSYYSKNGQEHRCMPPVFGGSLSAQLGLTPGTFDKKLYAAAIAGEFKCDLKQFKRTNPARAAYDVTISAPKSVSIAGLLLGDDRIIQAHIEACNAAMSQVEHYLRVQVEKDGQRDAQKIKGAAWTAFGHISSRGRESSLGPGDDPQLHTHHVLFKYVLCEDGTLRCLENKELLFASTMLDQYYKQCLSSKLKAIGYEIEPTKDGFEIVGIDRKLLGHFSTGRNVIDSVLDKSGLTRQSSTTEQRTIINKATRVSKTHASLKTLEDLQEWWKVRASGICASNKIDEPSLAALCISKHGSENPIGEKSVISAADAVDQALGSLTERSLKIRHKYELTRHAMLASHLHVPMVEINREIDRRLIEKSLHIRRDGRSLTTSKIIALEESLLFHYKNSRDVLAPIATHDNVIQHIQQAEKQLTFQMLAQSPPENIRDLLGVEQSDTGKDIFESLVNSGIAQSQDEAFELTIAAIRKATGVPFGAQFTDGQREMCVMAGTTKNAIGVVVGDAGTGKSTGMAAYRATAEAAGFHVVGLAPISKAVDELSKSIPDSKTLQSVLQNEKFWKTVNANTVIVLDEAGLVDYRNMNELLRRLEERRIQFAGVDGISRGPRLLLVGDDKQYSSVEAGYSFYQIKLAAQAAGAIVNLKDMQRGSAKKEPGKKYSMRDLHYMARDNPDRLLSAMHEDGRVFAFRNESARLALIGREYAKLSPEMQNKSLCLVGTNEDRIKISKAIRNTLAIKDEISFNTFETRDLTKIQKKNIAYYEIGDSIWINFNTSNDPDSDKKYSALNKGDILDVKGKDTAAGVLIVQRKGSTEEFSIDPKTMGERFSVGTRDRIALGTGDLIRFTQKNENLGILNGYRARVLSVDLSTESLRVHILETDKVTDIPFKTSMACRYGYAQTGHSVQSMTAGGKVFMYRMSTDPTFNANANYTDITRAQNDTVLVTDAVEGERIEKLAQAMASLPGKDSALFSPPNLRPPIPCKIYGSKGFCHIAVSDWRNREVLNKALRDAHEKLGDRLMLVGNEAFKTAALHLKVEEDIPIKFANLSIQYQVKNLEEKRFRPAFTHPAPSPVNGQRSHASSTSSTKENDHEQSKEISDYEQSLEELAAIRARRARQHLLRGLSARSMANFSEPKNSNLLHSYASVRGYTYEKMRPSKAADSTRGRKPILKKKKKLDVPSPP